jgi:hypothetical protein
LSRHCGNCAQNNNSNRVEKLKSKYHKRYFLMFQTCGPQPSSTTVL